MLFVKYFCINFLYDKTNKTFFFLKIFIYPVNCLKIYINLDDHLRLLFWLLSITLSCIDIKCKYTSNHMYSTTKIKIKNIIMKIK